jgi:hypothetical protein
VLKRATTRLTLTDKARQRIGFDLKHCTDYSPIAALFLELDADKSNPRWAVRYLDRIKVEASDIEAAIIDITGLQFVVPQTNLLEILDDIEIDWTGSEFKFAVRSGRKTGSG